MRVLILSLVVAFAYARPVVRNIRSAHEFDRLLSKHGSETGLPVVVDFYSDSCGPCRMMAPIFKKVAQEFVDKAVFVKVDTNAIHELSSRFGVRALPTFMWFVGGKSPVNTQKGGIGEGPLRQETQKAVRQAEMENVLLDYDDLVAYYQKVEPSKTDDELQTLYKKCSDMVKGSDKCAGPAANQLARRLKKKYKEAPKMQSRFTTDATSSSSSEETKSETPKKPRTSQSSPRTPSLHLATKEQLMEELERRLDEERDQYVEEEDEDEDEPDPDYHRWSPGPFPQPITIIGGGPAGMAAAIYAARAGLSPLVIAPSMGGQLQGKGVDVENYPALSNVTGPAVIASMRVQAAHFGALFEDDWVTSIDASQKPFRLHTNSTGIIETHAVVVATGAESKWLGIEGEWEMRGGGVSSCATCDGFLFSGKDVIVVGGGDTAMEDALVLARTSKSVTVVHRRDSFRASKVLATRVLDHPAIRVLWNTTLEKIEGKADNTGAAANNRNEAEEEDVDLDSDSRTDVQKIVTGAVLKDVNSGETRKIPVDAVFVAIGHSPSTTFLQGVVEFDPEHPGYVKTLGTSTHTSVPGIFAAGDVADSIYRQAITSAGSGAAAALDAERYLSENGLGNEAAEMEAELLREMMADDDTNIRMEGYNAYEDAAGRVSGIKESFGAEL